MRLISPCLKRCIPNMKAENVIPAGPYCSAGRARVTRRACMCVCVCHCFTWRAYECTHTDLFDKVCKSDCPDLSTLCARAGQVWSELGECNCAPILSSTASPSLSLVRIRLHRFELRGAKQSSVVPRTMKPLDFCTCAFVSLRGLVITPSWGPGRLLCPRTDTKKSLAGGDGWQC